MNDPHAAKLAALRNWLQRTDRAQVETGDGYVPHWLAAEAIGVSPSTLRRMRDERDTPLMFRPIGRGKARHGWQVALASIAAYLLSLENFPDVASGNSANKTNRTSSTGRIAAAK